MTERAYTTGEAAKVLQVAPRAVCRFFDQGKLRGYRVMSGHRRIPHSELARFCREYGLPEPPPASESGEEEGS